MKNRYINIVYKRLIGVTLTLAVCSVVMLAANKMGYSMGVDPDEAAYLNSLYDSGYSEEEVDRAMIEYEKEHHTGWYADDEPAPVQSQPSAQPEKAQPTTKQSEPNGTAKTTPAPTPAKAYSHDFDSITDEAREAFRAFTADGQPNSCYLNIDGTSKDNIITGKDLNATRTGKEDGKITFKDNGDTRYEWVFSNWTSEDEFSLDLTSHFIKIDNGRYELAFSGGDIGNNNVVFRLRTGTPSTKLFVYDGKSDKQGIVTDNNGFLTINLRTLGKYIVSTSAALSNDEVTNSINSVGLSGDDSFESTEIPFSTPEDVEDVSDDNMVTPDAETTEKPGTAAEQDEEDIFIDPGYSRKSEDKEDISKAESIDTVKKTESQSELVSEAVANNVLVIDDGPSLLNPLFIFIGLGVIVLATGGIVIYRYKR